MAARLTADVSQCQQYFFDIWVKSQFLYIGSLAALVAAKPPPRFEPARFFSIANIADIADILPKTMSYTFYKKFKPLLTIADISFTFYKKFKPLLTIADISYTNWKGFISLLTIADIGGT